MNKHIRRQLAYEKLVGKINKHKKDFLAISVEYHFSWNPIYFITHVFAYIVALSAYIKKRKNAIAHSAYIAEYGKHPRIIEASTSGVNHSDFYKYFQPSFKGKVYIHIIPAEITDKQREEHLENFKHNHLGRKYGFLKAINAWWDVGQEQEDSEDEDFCTDNMIDAYEALTNRQLVEKNAEWTPSQIFELMKWRYELLDTIDSKTI